MHDKLAFRENILGIEGFNYDITIISGAGAYICGENSALLNSIELVYICNQH